MAALLTIRTPSPPSSSCSSYCTYKQHQAIALLESCRPLVPSSPTRSTSRLQKAGRAYSLWAQFTNSPKKPDSNLPVELEAIANEEQLDSALASAQELSKPIIIDWMAAWCRKCIYLKPKLEKLATEYQPDIKFYYVDVNAVPQSLVKRADVTKMPTIQLWKNGEKCDEVIGGHKAWLVIDEVREMLQKHVR